MEASITELGTGIYVAEIMGVFAVNVGIVVGDDGACVIDTGTTQPFHDRVWRAISAVESSASRAKTSV